jgi:hypothetical protein
VTAGGEPVEGRKVVGAVEIDQPTEQRSRRPRAAKSPKAAATPE